jgi:hypothetical protein
MARLDEIAEGLATILRVSKQPEPLGVDLMNHTAVEATFLVRAVVDACERGVTPLSCIHVSSNLAGDLERQLQGESGSYEGVPIHSSTVLASRIEFFRFPPRSIP